MTNLDELLSGAGSVTIAGHIRPDGDCVGSCLAAYNYIRTYHREIRAGLYLEPIPHIFRFLARSEEIIHGFPQEEQTDLFLALDCGDTGRLGGMARWFQTAKKTVCIDHHISNTGFADVNYIYPEKSSTSELIFELLPEERLTKEIAECIYTGMIHDTGLFQYSSTSRKTMEAAGKLMELGIDYPGIVEKTFFARTYSQNRIMGLALIKSCLHLDGKCISSVITETEMREYGAAPRHLEGIVSQLRVTKGVEAAIFLYETGDGSYKVSMRSADQVDVSEIAVAHGGGGHRRAAGFSMQGDSAESVRILVGEVAGQLKKLQRGDG